MPMKFFVALFLSILSFSAKAQINNLPSFDNINGVTKTIMNPKLYPLLLKVHISDSSENTTEFKQLISNLNHFEIYAADQEKSGVVLSKQMNFFLNLSSYTRINENTYESVTDTQKEYLVLKQDEAEVPVLYAFTTKLDYSGISDLTLM